MDNQAKLSANAGLTDMEASSDNFKIIAHKLDENISAALGSNSEKDLSSNYLNCSISPEKQIESGWTEIFQLDEDLVLDSTSNVQSYLSDSSLDEKDGDDECKASSSGGKTRKMKACGSKAPNFVITLQRILNLYHEMRPADLVGSPQSFYLDHYLRWNSTPKEAIHVES